MIDNIKIHIPVYNLKKGTFDWKEPKNNDGFIYNKKFLVAKLYNPKTPKKAYTLKVLLTLNIKTDVFSLSISGSLRKWYFQENSRSDLNLDQYIECIELIAKGIKIDVDDLKKMIVTKLEIGVTLLLKSNMRSIIECFVKLRNAERVVFEETTLYFKFKNYGIVLYDKYLEMNKNIIWTNIEKNVYKKFYFLRFEINAKKISGTTLKGKFDTLGRIQDNWNELSQTIEKHMTAIVFVDTISEEKIIEINNVPILKKQLMFKAMKDMGIVKFSALFDKSIKTNNKNKDYKELINIYRSFITNDIDLKGILLVELRKKLNRLYNKGNV